MEKKKNAQVDFSDKRTLFLLIGICISLSLTLLAFEYKSVNEPTLITWNQETDDKYLYEPPITVIEPPKPPIQQPKLVEILDHQEPEIDLDPYIFQSDPTDYVHEDYAIIEEPAKEPTDEIIIFVEEEASFPGGNVAWKKFLSKNLNYPRQAQKSRIEGRVILSFVVNKEGMVSDIEVLRGIGAGCEEEAVRVLTNSPKWNAGKQRGVPVKSRRQIAFIFKLS